MKIELNYWKNLNTLLILLLVVSLLIATKDGPPAGASGFCGTLPLILLMLLYLSFLIFCVLNFREFKKPANLMTLLRSFGTLPFVLVPWQASRHWMIVFPLLSLLALSDLADGYIARRTGVSRFGAFLDEESDAFFTAVLPYLLYTRAGYGAWVLAFGGIRPVFFILFFITGRASSYPPGFSRFSRTICALSTAVLAGATAVVLPELLRTAALGLALGGLIVSFVWEFALNLTGGRYASFFGLVSSFLIYYGIPFKALRMRRFYAGFLSRGSLAFDIGSHIGNRIGAWSRLGAEVVAVEP
ncbi:MAG: CDP-alcohol phosphatidyltransferase family protein, partial [Sediminispirochaetaceae bacterium]